MFDIQSYPKALHGILRLGQPEPAEPEEWINYADTYGLSERDVPDIIKLACDHALDTSDSSGPEIWGPFHARRILGQMKVSGSLLPVLKHTATFDTNDWIWEGVPEMAALIGISEIQSVSDFLQDSRLEREPTTLAIDCLTQIHKRYPECRADCLVIATSFLSRYKANNATSNAWMIKFVEDIKGVESIDLVREAFAAGCVDLTLLGDIEDFEIEVGLRKERATPARNYMREAYPALGQFVDLIQHRMERELGLPTSRATPPQNSKRVAQKSVGRNDPCPCGSGKKYKKCCL